MMTYLITFSTYGSYLHGDERGSVDRFHNVVGAPARPEEPLLRQFEQREMNEEAYLLDKDRRRIVLQAIVDVCVFRGWELLAAHIRENHVHVVVEGESEPERIAGDFKEYSSRALNRSSIDGQRNRRWTRHGSMKRLFDRDARDRAIRYVLDGQGVPMAVYVATDRRAP